MKQRTALNEGQKILVETTASPIDTSLDWQLVYINGETSSTAPMLQDDIFWIKTDDLKLARKVEMYQWVEKSSSESKDNIWWSETTTTTYEYKKQRSEDQIDSNEFYEQAGHENPAREYTSKTREKDPILLGDYTLGESFTNKLSKETPVKLVSGEVIIPVKYEAVEWAKGEVAETTEQTEWSGETTQLTGEVSEVAGTGTTGATTETASETVATGTQAEVETPSVKKAHLFDSYIYIGVDPQKPQIGDMKISFITVKTGTASAIWQQQDGELVAHTASNGKTISLLTNGKVSSETMFANAHEANKTLTWIWRIVWLILMFTGFSMLFSVLVTLAKVLPFLSSLLWFWAGLIAFVLTLLVGWGTIAISWLVARPVIGIIMLAIIIVCIVLVLKFGKKKSG